MKILHDGVKFGNRKVTPFNKIEGIDVTRTGMFVFVDGLATRVNLKSQSLFQVQELIAAIIFAESNNIEYILFLLAINGYASHPDKVRGWEANKRAIIIDASLRGDIKTLDGSGLLFYKVIPNERRASTLTRQEGRLARRKKP